MSEKIQTEKIYEVLSRVIRQAVDNDGVHITPTMTAAEVAGWDSIAHVKIILQVEEEFTIRFEPSEIADFENIGDLVDLVQEKLGGRRNRR